jgi:hypothetical protein
MQLNGKSPSSFCQQVFVTTANSRYRGFVTAGLTITRSSPSRETSAPNSVASLYCVNVKRQLLPQGRLRDLPLLR